MLLDQAEVPLSFQPTMASNQKIISIFKQIIIILLGRLELL